LRLPAFESSLAAIVNGRNLRLCNPRSFCMLFPFVPFLALNSGAKETRILMLGNSHTIANNLPNTLASMLNSDGGDKVKITVRTGMFLDDIATPSTLNDLRSGSFDIVILQAAKMSSSHRYSYSQEAPLALAKAASASKTKVFWFPEWPRKGWDETAFILGIYGADAKAGGGTLIPIPRAFDAYLKAHPNADLWSPDGNHASPGGSYLAASTLHLWLRSGDKLSPAYVPAEVAPNLASGLRAAAQAVWKRFGLK